MEFQNVCPPYTNSPFVVCEFEFDFKFSLVWPFSSFLVISPKALACYCFCCRCTVQDELQICKCKTNEVLMTKCKFEQRTFNISSRERCIFSIISLCLVLTANHKTDYFTPGAITFFNHQNEVQFMIQHYYLN